MQKTSIANIRLFEVKQLQLRRRAQVFDSGIRGAGATYVEKMQFAKLGNRL
jgi:hypothetical protein